MSSILFLHRLLQVLGVFSFNYDPERPRFTTNHYIKVYYLLIFLLRQLSCLKFVIFSVLHIMQGRKAFIDSSFVTTILYFCDDSITLAITLLVNFNVLIYKKELLQILSALKANDKLLRTWYYSNSCKKLKIVVCLLTIGVIVHIGLHLLDHYKFTNAGFFTNFPSIGFFINLLTQKIYILFEATLILTVSSQMKTLRHELQLTSSKQQRSKLFKKFSEVIRVLESYQNSFAWVSSIRKLSVFISFMLLFYTIEEFMAQNIYELRLIIHFLSEFLWDLPQIATLFYFWSLGMLDGEVL